MKIRSQQYAQTAYVLVESVKQQKDEYEKIVRQAEQESSKDKREALEKQAGEKKELVAKYRTLALNFPNMVLQSGLCQAVGFLAAKGKIWQRSELKDDSQESRQAKPYALLLEHLMSLLECDGDVIYFHEKIWEADLTQYQLLTRKTLEASSYLKRYTQAFLPESSKNEDQSNG